MGRQEFVDKTDIPKNSLIGIEVGKHEPGAKALMAIAINWPEYSEYLLTGNFGTKQEDPSLKLELRKASLDNERFLPLLSPDLKPEDMKTRKMKKLQKEFDEYMKQLEYRPDLATLKK